MDCDVVVLFCAWLDDLLQRPRDRELLFEPASWLVERPPLTVAHAERRHHNV